MKQTQKKSKRIWTVVLTVIVVAELLVGAVILFRNASEKVTVAEYPLKYTEFVERYAAEYDLPESLVYAVIYTESHFRADAQSSAGAIGLMQITPPTFEWAQWREKTDPTLPDEALLDPETNIHFGCLILRLLIDLYDNEQTALAAYNAGMGNVRKWLDDKAYSDDGVTLQNIPFRETMQYVERVNKAREQYQKLYNLN